jgi:hypothetical protein
MFPVCFQYNKAIFKINTEIQYLKSAELKAAIKRMIRPKMNYISAYTLKQHVRKQQGLPLILDVGQEEHVALFPAGMAEQP